MKLFRYLIFTGLLFTSLSVFSQNTPAKGYYTIGNNASKLTPTPAIKVDTVVPNEVPKGYYSIKSHQDKLKPKSGWFTQKATGPVFTKGYYTIGDNWKKQKL